MEFGFLHVTWSVFPQISDRGLDQVSEISHNTTQWISCVTVTSGGIMHFSSFDSKAHLFPITGASISMSSGPEIQPPAVRQPQEKSRSRVYDGVAYLDLQR